MDNIYRIATYYRKLKQKSPILYLFLKEKKVLKVFAKNCRYNKYPKSIMSAFGWHETKEGVVYWSKLSLEFGKYYDKSLKEL
jgi:hypothetical protein